MKRVAVLIVLALLSCTGAARAADFTVTVKDHVFSPPAVSVATGKRFTVLVKNLDATPAELYSETLGVDPLILEADGVQELKLGPLKYGNYDLFDTFHADAKLVVSAR